MRKFIILLAFCLPLFAFSQEIVRDKAIENQSQRMVYAQWNQNDFYPKAGFLDLNPYYWLVWGLFDPNYHKTDLRPLSVTGPQTQRLALVAAQNSTDNKYKLQSDTLRNTALSEIASQSGLLSDADPLWLLYYKQQFQPLLNYSSTTLLGPLAPSVSAKLVSEGTYNWYSNELSMLKQRLNGARTTDQDRGSRIMAYYRMLAEYQRLTGIWSIRVATAQKDIQMTTQAQQVKTQTMAPVQWTPQSDIQIANKVLTHVQ
ncbi:MAG: hypothetical protein ACXVJB_00115 [Mucilaginibacter sp.]